ncbi:hypothetical protein G6O69_00785 [Pseudenhygromyxa sp. WMMC2535]|uniref:hypothetical protein n=1 Tax=Pseudenhygromyxa sp. WMMC2535 TaxID=2712867 RepID=UPI00155586A5|nr:hypothetical protein [Pseudenhygromyxa sp. WMMC2535]NVB36345.1 hypothetical protein [Pseudenhygromyxa sp. WMMC2535]
MLHASRALVALAALAMMRTCPSEQEPCQYEDSPLSADDLTPWGSVVGEELAQLVGPYEGTWYWKESHEYVEIVDGGQAVPASATLELDLESIRLHEYVAGRGVACAPTGVEVEGVLTFRDAEEQVLLRAPLTVFRGENLYYADEMLRSPVEDYTSKVIPSPEIESQLDSSGLSVVVDWGPEGESLYADLVYGGVEMLTDGSGWGPSVYVAEFIQ